MTQTKPHEINLPLPPEICEGAEMEIYTRFMRHLRCVPNSRMAIKVLSAIQFTADMVDYSDAHVAKLLVELGLRAPRMAFPADFLRFADQALMRSGWDVGAPGAALYELRDYWNAHGEDRFAGFKRDYPLRSEEGAFA
ncbi:MAG: hypothetical protein R3E13_00535 [Alphaproteobacteria bacterium]